MSKTQQQQAAAPTPATQDAAPETDTPAQLYKLMTESDTPEKAAAILRANPQIAQFYVDSLHKGYGNEFTMKAIELASDADHSLNVRGRSQLKQSETKVVDAKPSATEVVASPVRKYSSRMRDNMNTS